MKNGAQVAAAVERAMFDAMETTVRYHEGTASAAELAIASQRLRIAVTLERRRLECDLFAFRRRPEHAPAALGH